MRRIDNVYKSDSRTALTRGIYRRDGETRRINRDRTIKYLVSKLNIDKSKRVTR